MNSNMEDKMAASGDEVLNSHKDGVEDTTEINNIDKGDIKNQNIEDMLENCDLKDDNHYNIDEEYLKEIQSSLNETELKELLQKALSKKDSGNILYKSESFKEASLHYTDGLRLCPLSSAKERAILYANRAAARSTLSKDDMKAAIKDLDKAIEYDPTYVKAVLRRANFNLTLDQLEDALADFEEVIKLNPSNSEARQAKSVLPSRINEKNEKLKAEMMGKLKDFGNMILKPFGMSTSNFEMKQDDNTGGYNINFKQNPNN